MMKVTAKEVRAGWLDDSRDTYHTDQKPVGHDRKEHEGIPTQEEFPNTWLPTQKCKPEGVAVEQIEVVTMELAAKTASTVAAPAGVPQSLFDAWEVVKDVQGDFDWKRTPAALYTFTEAMVRFIVEGDKIGLDANPEQVARLKRYTQDHPPRNREKYAEWEVDNHLYALDVAVSRVHSEVARLLGVPQEKWYEAQSARLKDDPGAEFQTSQDRKWLQEQRTPQPYQGDPMLKELWEQKRRNELTGRRVMKITAGDVIPIDRGKKLRFGPKRVEPPNG